jgi:hypothetical protein
MADHYHDRAGLWLLCSLAFDRKAAKAAGDDRKEIAENAFVATALRAGGDATHGATALEFFDQE